MIQFLQYDFTIQVETADIRDIIFHRTNAAAKPSFSRVIPPPTGKEITGFLQSLNCADLKPAIFKITKPFASEFIPHVLNPSYPHIISELYDQDALAMDYASLLKRCEELFSTIKVSNLNMLVMAGFYLNFAYLGDC